MKKNTAANRVFFVLASFLLLLIFISCNRKKTENLRVATSANMQFAMEELIGLFQIETGIETEMILSSSGKLTAQILHKAPYDVFVSADMKYPDTLHLLGFTTEKPEIYAYGKLVIWTLRKDLNTGFDALNAETVKHIAMANPETAPYGAAARSVLIKKGLYKSLKPKLVFGESVSQTNRFILSGVADIGFTAQSVVYSKISNKGKWMRVPDSLYNPIAQGVVVLNIRNNNRDKALQFKKFLLSDKARKLLRQFGYQVPEFE